MEKSNYKVYANLGMTVLSTKCFLVIFDAGAGLSFIMLNEIPQAMRYKIRKLYSAAKISNSSGKVLPSVETIELMVQIRCSTKIVTFHVPRDLEISVILRFDFCDRHVEEIKP